MSRTYLKTADPKPTPTEMRRRKLAAARADKIAEYKRLKQAHDRRAKTSKELVEITSALIATELKQPKPAVRPPAPVADLFAR